MALIRGLIKLVSSRECLMRHVSVADRNLGIAMKFTLLILFFLNETTWADSNILSEQKLYRRCYSQLVQSPIPLKDPTFQKIKAGQLKAIDACLSLINEADFDNQGLIKSDPVMFGTVQQKVLRTFFEFHNSWFGANSITQIQDYNEELERGSTDIYDPYEQSYFLTRALFTKDARYSSVLQGTERLKSARIEDIKHITAVRGGPYVTKAPSRRVLGDSATNDENLVVFNSMTIGYTGDGDARPDEDFVKMPMVSIGALIGIQSLTEPFTIKNLNLDPLGRNLPGNKEPNLEFTYNLNRNHGGGIIGLPSYFMMNYGHGRGLKFNGTTKLPRRWVKSIMETFMCATLPTLRESDITDLVVPASNTPFRKSSSCVQCHATMDQAAGVARNLITGASDFFAISTGRHQNAKYPMMLTQYNQVKEGPTTWIDVDNPEFHITKAKGKLYTRLFNGDLLDRPVSSIDELGIAISQTQDFYSCAAKRYFQFFTGIQVPLYDKKDPRNSEMNRLMTEEHIKNRAFVESLGVDLQQDQSLKNLIKRIISSDYYKSESY